MKSVNMLERSEQYADRLLALGSDKKQILDALISYMESTSLKGVSLMDHSLRKYQAGSETLSSEQLGAFLIFDLTRALIGWADLSDLVNPDDHLAVIRPVLEAFNKLFGFKMPTNMDLVRMIFVEKNMTTNDPIISVAKYRTILFDFAHEGEGTHPTPPDTR